MGSNVTITLNHASTWTNQSWFDIFTSPVANITGSLMYLIFGLIIFGMLWVKSEHTVMLGVIGIIYTALVIGDIPKESQVYALMFVALTISIIVYRVFWRRD